MNNLLTDRLTVYETDGEEETKVIEAVPCRISYNSNNYASQDLENAEVIQSVKIFVKPETEIKSGSKIEVDRNGVVMHFKAAGIMNCYSSHNEITAVKMTYA
jgi:hypothetical protein